MTIKRQYVLPNCSLILEGLSTDASDVLSILANAEFKIIGVEKSLQGGSDFFKALIVAVSAYCQRLLSGLEHPAHMSSQTSLVAVEPDSGQYHRLILKPEILDDIARESLAHSEAKTIKLSTVQLFDMAEAIDQFYADNQTLPDLSVKLAPLPRRYVRASEPLAQRAIPPLLGAGTLAIAALGLFFLPVPELVEPEGLDQQNTAALEDTSPAAGDEPEPTAEPTTEPATDATETPADQATVDAPPSPITDSAQLATLQQQVQQQITGKLSGDATFEQPLSYQISVTQNGDIVGYKPLDTASLEGIDSTPLPGLTYVSTEDAIAESVAQFAVTFAPDGTVKVLSDQIVTPETVTSEPEPPSPGAEDNKIEPSASTSAPREINGETSNETSGEVADSSPQSASTAGNLGALVAQPIQDADRIYELNEELRRTIINARANDWSGPELRYRVRLDSDGTITGYEAANAPAEQYANEFKLPSLVKVPATEKPQLDFLVVINDSRVVEVNPWNGWPR
ncbi:DUF4335 domain-containing protein [Leptothoe sp. PORK10 BA2]|uniref:DUF4335 domain-containing protein n=1 Tax=Leptothoe sp. PORK10 BA2 TaxID=3110254 RepID=UPI002B1FA73D|nr:DUF4335 domain-containing protein [Leptothoe sp. PORK10 BA2]MEA5466527.1 DUF4335 domain-containing protein [Leptothoe sp. PORK10 BA2]